MCKISRKTAPPFQHAFFTSILITTRSEFIAVSYLTERRLVVNPRASIAVPTSADLEIKRAVYSENKNTQKIDDKRRLREHTHTHTSLDHNLLSGEAIAQNVHSSTHLSFSVPKIDARYSAMARKASSGSYSGAFCFNRIAIVEKRASPLVKERSSDREERTEARARQRETRAPHERGEGGSPLRRCFRRP